MAIQTWGSLKFVGPGAATVANWFRDQFTPAPSKNEWGIDQLFREIKGPASLFEDFINGLAPGQTYTFKGKTFHLQTWQEIADPVFPGARLYYKGLTDGLPDATGANSTSVRTASKSAEVTNSAAAQTINPAAEGDKVFATRVIEYYAPETQWRYVRNTKPNGPTHTGLNTTAQAVIKRSIIRATVEGVSMEFGGNAPAALVTATNMIAVATVVSHSANEVHGTPFWECTDTVIHEFQGD